MTKCSLGNLSIEHGITDCSPYNLYLVGSNSKFLIFTVSAIPIVVLASNLFLIEGYFVFLTNYDWHTFSCSICFLNFHILSYSCSRYDVALCISIITEKIIFHFLYLFLVYHMPSIFKLIAHKQKKSIYFRDVEIKWFWEKFTSYHSYCY